MINAAVISEECGNNQRFVKSFVLQDEKPEGTIIVLHMFRR
jgi:hypothetical protein